MDWSIDGLMDDSIDGLIDVSMDGWMDRSNDLWIDGSMDCPLPPLPHLLWPPRPPLNLTTAIPSSLERILSTRHVSASYPYQLSHWYPRLLRNGGFLPRWRACRSKQRTHVNVDVNVDLWSTLSCELVGRLQNLKRWKFSTAHMPGRWRGGRWSEKSQLGRCTNQRWGAQVRTHQKYVLAQWFFDITDFFPDTTVFTIKKLALRTSEIKR